MNYEEKYGVLWGVACEDHLGTTVYEYYQQDTGLLGMVFRRRDGCFKAVVFRKVNSPQWRLPWWGETRQDGIYATEADAVKYVTDMVQAKGPQSGTDNG